ncbi:MAG: MarR family transcriptional regulator [Pseudorhodobacter sp.]|nr:MarR family transcriptional regulator [Pseudorhodobacter sp.]
MATETVPKRPISLGRQLNFAAGASMSMCNALLDAHGLTLPQWVVLSVLWAQDGLTVGAIAEYTGNNLPATSRILDRMVEKSLLRREEDAQDRRTVRIMLCPAGDRLRPLARFHEQVNDALMAGFTPQETSQLLALLDRVEQNARAVIRSETSDESNGGNRTA